MTPGPFINVTNHPSAEWGAEQRATALKLGSPIIDVPFPRVDPLATEAQVADEARRVFERVLSEQSSAVAVQGEHTFALYLVALLLRAGIDCYAATTAREVEVAGDMKMSRFAFQQWRRYALPPTANDRSDRP
jgi:hypothetical protein